MNELREGAFVTVGRPVTAEKVRLDGLRLECLKLATNGDQLMGTDDAIQVAQVLFDYVTEAPKSPTLFVVRRTREIDCVDPESTYLNVNGDWLSWGRYEGHAHRFRSREEADRCMQKHHVALFGDRHATWSVDQLPDGTDLF